MTRQDERRAAFERLNRIPDDVMWSERRREYVWADYPNTTEHSINDLWESFCEGADWHIKRVSQGNRSQSRDEAKAAGKTHYHGRPCGNCGKTKRYVSDYNCVFCARQKHREWVADNRDYYLNYLREYGKEYRQL